MAKNKLDFDSYDEMINFFKTEKYYDSTKAVLEKAGFLITMEKHFSGYDGEFTNIFFQIDYDFLDLHNKIVSLPLLTYTIKYELDAGYIYAGFDIESSVKCKAIQEMLKDSVPEATEIVYNETLFASNAKYKATLEDKTKRFVDALKYVYKEVDENFDKYVSDWDLKNCTNQVLQDVFLF